MTREEVIQEIEEIINTIQLRTQGVMDWLGEVDPHEEAERIFRIAQEAA